MSPLAQTWRVVLDSGEVRAVELVSVAGEWYVFIDGKWGPSAAIGDARWVAALYAVRLGLSVAEVRGPGEMTTAEQLAAALAECDAAVAMYRRVANERSAVGDRDGANERWACEEAIGQLASRIRGECESLATVAPAHAACRGLGCEACGQTGLASEVRT